MKAAILAAALAALVLSACRAPVPEPRTMHFFELHAAERANIIAKCKTSNEQYEPAEECANAMRAQRQVNIDHDAGGGTR